MQDRRFRNCSIVIFIGLWLYLILRALFVTPLHDETATFFHFIETGAIWGPGSLPDANNHLLNSFLGRFVYLVFGEHYFLFRLPTVIAFAFFFRAAYLLAKEQTSLFKQLTLLLALTTVHYVFDYFGYTRGYGLALTFLLWGFVYLKRWLEGPSVATLMLLYACFWLAVFSSITCMVSACLAATLAVFMQLWRIREITLKKHVTYAAVHLGFAIGLLPLVKFSFFLKAAGALYYGSMNGFWNVTLKTLCRYVLFYDANWLKHVFTLGILLLFVFLIYLFAKRGFIAQLIRTESIAAYLVTGNVMAIFFLAKVMDVNYPEDRAAMYLIPLGILLLATSLFQLGRFSWLGGLLLFFPLSFLWKMNLNTSVFTADERITDSFYATVKQHADAQTMIAGYPTMALNWPRNERRQPGAAQIMTPIYVPYTALASDIVMTKKVMLYPWLDWAAFDVIAEDKASGTIALKRRRPFQKMLIFDTLIPAHASDGEFIPIYSGKIPGSRKGFNIQTSIRGLLEIDSCYQTMDLVVATFDAVGTVQRYDYVNLRWYEGEHSLKFPFNWQYAAGKWKKHEEEVRIYIWNPQHSKVSLNSGEVRMFKLKQSVTADN